MKWYIMAIKKYADFKGRSRRKEYWMFALVSMMFGITALVLDHLLGLSFNTPGNKLGYGFIYMAYGLFIFMPGLSVGVRRMHDVGKSGWMCLIGIIPIIGTIWFLVQMCKDGQPGVNKYGVNPKGGLVEESEIF